MGTSAVVLVQTVPNSRTRYVPSEGASGLILNTRSAAILWRDGNNNLAIVTSTDVRHQGHVVRHIAIQISLLKKADIAPAEFEYVAFYFHENRIKIYLLFIEARGTCKHLIFLFMALIQAISLRLRASTKFSSHFMDLRTLSLLLLVLATSCQA